MFGPQPGMALMAAIDPVIPFGPQPGMSSLQPNAEQTVSMSSIAKVLLLISLLHKGN